MAFADRNTVKRFMIVLPVLWGIATYAVAADGAPSGERFRPAPALHARLRWDAMLDLEAASTAKRRGEAARDVWMPVPADSANLPPSLADLPPLGATKGLETGPHPLAPPLETSFEAIQQSSMPPDTNGAVGPAHLMVVVNFRVRIQTREGLALSTVSLQTFFSPFSFGEIFDPKVIYDALSGRFVVVACADKRVATSSMLLGVSESSDPTQGWRLFSFRGDETGTDWVDYPNLGCTRDYITFTGNMFRVVGDQFRGANLWVVDKAAVLAGANDVATRMRLTGVGGSLAPALTFDEEESTQYIVGATFPSLGVYGIHTVTGPADQPQFATTGYFPRTEAWAESAIGAPQLGTSVRIASNDGRIMNAVVRNGRFWYIHHVGLPLPTPNHFVAQWVELDVEAGSPTQGQIVQYGRIDDFGTTGLSYLYPTLSVNMNNDVMFGFTGTSSTTYAGAYYTFRAADAAPGSTESVSIFKAGESPYPRNRWGDYSATCVDPADGLTLWTMQEYARAGGEHGTWWGKLARVDTRPPRARFARALDSESIEVVFDEPMTDNAALVSPENFQFSGDGVTLAATEVVSASARRLTISVNEMTNGAAYRVSLSSSEQTDLSGNAVSSDPVDFLGIGIPPMVSVDPLETEKTSPKLTGTVDDPEATVLVQVGEQPAIPGENLRDGRWRLATGMLVDLAPGIYDVAVTATDLGGNTGTDTTTYELVVNPPEVPAAGWVGVLVCMSALAALLWRKRRPGHVR